MVRALLLMLALLFGQLAHATVAEGTPVFTITNHDPAFGEFRFMCDGVTTTAKKIVVATPPTTVWRSAKTDWSIGTHTCFARAKASSGSGPDLAVSNAVTFTIAAPPPPVYIAPVLTVE